MISPICVTYAWALFYFVQLCLAFENFTWFWFFSCIQTQRQYLWFSVQFKLRKKWKNRFSFTLVVTTDIKLFNSMSPGAEYVEMKRNKWMYDTNPTFSPLYSVEPFYFSNMPSLILTKILVVRVQLQIIRIYAYSFLNKKFITCLQYDLLYVDEWFFLCPYVR